MRNMVETVLRWLGILRGQEIYYIGGSDILPPPLKGQEEQSALQAMESSGTVWVPTLSTVGNLRGKGRFPEDAVERILDSALSNVAVYKGLLAAGTDAGAWAVPHGSTTEAGYFAMAGVGENRLQEGLAVIRRKF